MLLISLKRFFSTTSSTPLLYAEHIPCLSPTPSSKPNLLVIHGILGNSTLYRPFALSPFIRSNYNSYVLDLPDHDKSFYTDKISVPHIGRSIAHWIKQQIFKKDLAIVAHSLGGRSVVSMTAEFPQLQSIVKPIILLDVATHSYEGFPFHKKTAQYLKILQQIDLNKSTEQILTQLRRITQHDNQFQMMKATLDLPNKKWRFNLKALRAGYQQLIKFEIEKADWKEEIHAIKALRSAFMNDYSKEELKRIYPQIKIQDVDCYHNIQVERPDLVYDILKENVKRFQ